jgi:hypothetical protein
MKMTRFIENDIAAEVMKNSKPTLHETAIRIRNTTPQRLEGSFQSEVDAINALVEEALLVKNGTTQPLAEAKELPRNYVGKDKPAAVKQKPEKGEEVRHVGKQPKAMKGKPQENKSTKKKKYVGESKRTLAEAFMKPEIYEGDAYVAEGNMGGGVIPADLVGELGLNVGDIVKQGDANFEGVKEALADFIEGEIFEVSFEHGWLGRYQAPGYMDATEWALYKSQEEAEKHLQDMYGDDEEETEVENESEEMEESEGKTTLRKLYNDKSEKWLQHNLSGLTDVDAEITRIPTQKGCVANYECKGGTLCMTDTTDIFETDGGEEHRLENVQESISLQTVVERLNKKAQKLGESNSKEHKKLAFFINERLLPYAQTKTEEAGSDEQVMKDLASALRMLASKLTDETEKKDLNDMAFSMAKPEIPAASPEGEEDESPKPMGESKKKIKKSLKEDEDSDEESSDDSEEDDSEESESQNEPQEEDIVMQPSGRLGARTLVSVVGGKKIGEFIELDDAEKAIQEYMKKNNVYPTVWQISDHGNASVYAMDKQMSEAKGAKESTWLANELDEKYHPLVSEVSKKLGYDVTLVPRFCVALLENVNAHPEAKAVNDALLMSMEESKQSKMNEAKGVRKELPVIKQIAELLLVDHIASELEEKGKLKEVHGHLDKTIPEFVKKNYPSASWDVLVGEVLPELSKLTVAPEKLIEGVKKFGEDEMAWELFNQLTGHGGSHGEEAADFVEENFDFYSPDVGRDVAMKIVDAIYPESEKMDEATDKDFKEGDRVYLPGHRKSGKIQFIRSDGVFEVKADDGVLHNVRKGAFDKEELFKK